MTMKFADFQKMFTKHSKQVLAEGNLFLLDIDRDLLWETYLESFPAHGNKIFRERREMDCSCCRSAVKNIGNLVAITNQLEVVTLWDFDTNDDVYQPMLEAMRGLLRAHVSRAFFTKNAQIGTKVNLETLESGASIEWRHLYLEIPAQYVTQDVGAKQEERRALSQVFERSLKEITADAIATVLDLIEENTLYKGAEWKAALTKFQQLRAAYANLTEKKRNRFAWRESGMVGASVAKIRNHSIGTLLTDLSEGMEVDHAVRRYEAIVAPDNYKRPKAIYTKQMVENAEKTVAAMGLGNSLGRRYATIDDVKLPDVLWANRNAKRGNGTALNVFEQMRDEIAISPSKFKNVQGVGIDQFLAMLPSVKNLEVLFEQRLAPNLVSLTAPKDGTAPSLFKWRNGRAWEYNGGLADSMKQQVRDAGGFGDGFFRFSIRWNKEGDNRNDYDAHCRWANGHVYYGNKREGKMELDVDIIHPQGVAVENITTRYEKDLPIAEFTVGVHCFSHNGGTSGFDSEVELGGDIYYFDYPHNIPYKAMVDVARIKWDGRKFAITPLIPTGKGGVSSNEIWGIGTNQFHPVSIAMFSPNHWESEAGIGNKHVMFMVNGCVNDGTPRGFYNEFLHQELMPHKHVFEALGSRMKVEPSTNQLSGLGFSTTQRESLIVRADGKVLKIVF